MPTHPIDTTFFAPRTPVSIVGYGKDSSEALQVRAIIESLGAVTHLHLPGTPEDFLIILSQSQTVPPYMILCGHGDETGFIFEEYIREIDTSTLVGTSMPPQSVQARICLPGCVIVSTGCLTGCSGMAKAFLNGQIKAYIAPDNYPHGWDTPLFIMMLFHRLLVRQTSVEEAWRYAVACDEGCRTFVFWTHDGVQRYSTTIQASPI